jgi:hypothetical protein
MPVRRALWFFRWRRARSLPPAHEGFPALQLVTVAAYGGREASTALVVALRVKRNKSRGTVKSKSTNPAAVPLIDPNFSQRR